MKLNFSISEFIIDGDDVPKAVADKILKWHISPMQDVRDELGLSVHCKTSKGLYSGYRPYSWEISHGRKGGSQHTFGQRKNGSFDKNHRGAIDWRCKNFSKNKETFLQLIMDKTNYTRIAIYGSFLHCDYKARDGKRYLYDSSRSSKWTLLKTFT